CYIRYHADFGDKHYDATTTGCPRAREPLQLGLLVAEQRGRHRLLRKITASKIREHSSTQRRVRLERIAIGEQAGFPQQPAGVGGESRKKEVLDQGKTRMWRSHPVATGNPVLRAEILKVDPQGWHGR